MAQEPTYNGLLSQGQSFQPKAMPSVSSMPGAPSFEAESATVNVTPPEQRKYSGFDLDKTYSKKAAEFTPSAGTKVEDRLSGLLSSGSDYLKRAEGKAKTFANRRGLLNSSMAAGAGAAAAIDAAMPIAQQDAASETAFDQQRLGFFADSALSEQQAYNVSRQSSQDATQRSGELVQQFQNQTGINNQQANQQSILSTQGANQTAGLARQQGEITQTVNRDSAGLESALSAQNAGQQSALQAQGANEGMRAAEQAFIQQLGLNVQNFDFQRALNDQNYRQQLGISEQDFQEALAVSEQAFTQQSQLQSQANSEAMQRAEQSFIQQLGLNEQGFDFQRALSDQSYRQQLGISEQDFQEASAIASQQFQQALGQSQQQFEFQRTLQTMDQDTRKELLATQQQYAMLLQQSQAASNRFQDIAQQIAAIQSNPQMDANNKQKAVSQLITLMNQSMNTQAEFMKAAGLEGLYVRPQSFGYEGLALETLTSQPGQSGSGSTGGTGTGAGTGGATGQGDQPEQRAYQPTSEQLAQYQSELNGLESRMGETNRLLSEARQSYEYYKSQIGSVMDRRSGGSYSRQADQQLALMRQREAELKQAQERYSKLKDGYSGIQSEGDFYRLIG